MNDIIIAWIGTIFLPAFIVLAVFHWSTRMNLEYEKDRREVDIKFKEYYKKEWSKEYDLHNEWEHKYNQLLKNFQKYIDEHGNQKHHQSNCYSSTAKGITDEQLEQIKQELRECWEEDIYQKNPPVNHSLLPKAEKEQLEKWKNGEIKLVLDFDDGKQHWTSNNRRNTYKRW